jgi:hypothetical protein
MPTPTRTLAGLIPTTGHVVDGCRGVAIEVGVVAAPPEELLPSGGPGHPAATVRPGSRPRRATRTDAAFQRRVWAIHAQLLPLQTRSALAWSYAREAGRGSAMRESIDGELGVSAVQAAYALRWFDSPSPQWRGRSASTCTRSCAAEAGGVGPGNGPLTAGLLPRPTDRERPATALAGRPAGSLDRCHDQRTAERPARASKIPTRRSDGPLPRPTDRGTAPDGPGTATRRSDGPLPRPTDRGSTGDSLGIPTRRSGGPLPRPTDRGTAPDGPGRPPRRSDGPLARPAARNG